MQPALAPAPHPSMQSTAQDHADQVLHDQLVAAAHANATRPQQSPSHAHLQPNRDQNSNIDPAIAGGPLLAASNPNQPPVAVADAGVAAQPTDVTDPNASPDTRKTYGKRELSTSKRAAQNRAAQRAFRQRKEGYIRKLEEQVKDYNVLLESYKALQAENYQLREYIISLQSRLIDSQNEVPELPGNIDLTQPRPEPPSVAAASDLTAGSSAAGGASSATPTPLAPQQQQNQPSAPPASASTDDMSQLGRLAVAGLGMRKHGSDDSAASTFLGQESYPSPKRARIDDSADTSVKTETANGLPAL